MKIKVNIDISANEAVQIFKGETKPELVESLVKLGEGIIKIINENEDTNKNS